MNLTKQEDTWNYLYLIDLEINPSEVSHLNDALEDESFPIRDILGDAELKERIKSGRFVFSADTSQRYLWFRESIQCLSIYVSTYVRGIEVEENFDGQGERLRTKVYEYVGRRGELLIVPLDYTIDEEGVINPGKARVSYLEANWNDLPRWAQDGYRLSFPELRDL